MTKQEIEKLKQLCEQWQEDYSRLGNQLKKSTSVSWDEYSWYYDDQKIIVDALPKLIEALESAQDLIRSIESGDARHDPQAAAKAWLEKYDKEKEWT